MITIATSSLPVRHGLVMAFTIPTNTIRRNLFTSSHKPSQWVRSRHHMATADVAKSSATTATEAAEPFYITTPIYYVNDKPHIGHAYTSTVCDVLARYMRLSGRDVFFLTGTDEHGQKVEASAQAKAMSPQEFVDINSQTFRNLNDLLNISNDDFIRTTQEQHQNAVKHLWNVLLEKGYIYLGSYEGWYSIRDECFYVESELVDGKAPTGAEVQWVTEQSYFFKLSEFQQPLLQWYRDHPDCIAPDSRRNEVLRFVEGGLRDLSISRTSFSWGIPVPGDEQNHVMYVWIDALTN